MKCPVCGKEHEPVALWFNGTSITIIPCPDVPVNDPFILPKMKPAVVPKEPCPLCQKPTPCEHTAWIDDMIAKGK